MADKINLEKLFIESKGKTIYVEGHELIMHDRIKLEHLETYWDLEFIETNSKWKQGIGIKTKGKFEIDGLPAVEYHMVLWEDTAPDKVSFKVTSINSVLQVYNVWDLGDGVMHYWHNCGAMELELKNNKRIYHCNDGYPDLDLNDLVFSLQEQNGR